MSFYVEERKIALKKALDDLTVTDKLINVLGKLNILGSASYKARQTFLVKTLSTEMEYDLYVRMSSVYATKSIYPPDDESSSS